MGQAKKRKENNPTYGKPTKKQQILSFWKEDVEYLIQRMKEGRPTARFWLYKGIVFTNRRDLPGVICRAIDSDRYDEHKNIIDEAIADLAGKEDGVWYFNKIDQWHRKPLPDVLIDDLESELQMLQFVNPYKA